MARRGLALHHIHFASPPYTSLRAKLKVRDLARELVEYTGNCTLFVVPYTKPQDGARHPLPADEQFTKDTLLDVDAFWDAFHTPWINQFTGTAHRLYAARLFDGVRYPVGLLHEDYYVLPDLIAHCSAVYCMAFTGYYVLRHAGSITDGARHEVRLAMTKGDIHRAEYFLRNGWYDRAEGALTDAALFLHDNKRAYDLTKPGHRAEFAETKHELCRVYDALAAQKGSASMKLRAAALRAGLGVFAMYVRARG